MESIASAAFGAPIPNVLILAGIGFLLIAVLGHISANIDPGKFGRIAAGVLGAGLLAGGIAMIVQSGAGTAPKPAATAENTPPAQQIPSGKPTIAALADGIAAANAAPKPEAAPRSAAEQAQNSELLKEVLAKSAQGDCPDSMMSALVVGTCMKQQPKMGQRIAALGEIQNLTYIGSQRSPRGPADVYNVTFAKGTMTWMIKAGADGKIIVLFSPR